VSNWKALLSFWRFELKRKFGYYFAYFRDLDGNKFATFCIAPQAG
jgi:hypothetical protein